MLSHEISLEVTDPNLLQLKCADLQQYGDRVGEDAGASAVFSFFFFAEFRCFGKVYRVIAKESTK